MTIDDDYYREIMKAVDNTPWEPHTLLALKKYGYRSTRWNCRDQAMERWRDEVGQKYIYKHWNADNAIRFFQQIIDSGSKGYQPPTGSITEEIINDFIPSLDEPKWFLMEFDHSAWERVDRLKWSIERAVNGRIQRPRHKRKFFNDPLSISSSSTWRELGEMLQWHKFLRTDNGCYFVKRRGDFREWLGMLDACFALDEIIGKTIKPMRPGRHKYLPHCPDEFVHWYGAASDIKRYCAA